MTDAIAHLRQRSHAHPLVVSHPLKRLLDALAACEDPRSAHWSMAYLCLRDASEGVARLIWAVLVRDVFTLMERLPSLAALGEEAQAAVQDVLSTLRAHFTMGSVGWLVSRRVWQRLGALDGDHLVPCARDLLTIGKAWMGPLEKLKQWRNTDIAHGCLGDPLRLAPLFDLSDTKSPFAQLVVLLNGLDGWLAGVHARDGLWPDEGDATTGSIAPIAVPISWTGEGEQLWLLEGVSVSRQPRLLLRGILTGRLRTDLQAPEAMSVWASWFSTTGVQRTEAGRPLVVDQRARKRLVEVEESVVQRRDVEPTPLLQWLDERANGTAYRICVIGSSGSGKTRLLRIYAAARARRADEVVIWIASARDYPITPGRFVTDVNRQLEEAEGLLLPGHGAERLTTVVDEARQWWSDLTSLNPSTHFAVVIDGLDETTSRGSAADVLELLPPDSEARITTILGYRAVREVEPHLQAALARIESTAAILNLDTFYESAEGKALLLRYLELRHPTLKGHVPRDTLPTGAALAFDGSIVPIRDAIVAASAGRFLYVFHLARALETGVLSETGAQRWPEADRLYVTLLTHLEALTGHHRGYVTALRRVLLTLAHAECPLNDLTVCELLDIPGTSTQSAPTPDEEVGPWLLTVFSHVRDLVERRRVSGDLSDEEMSTAWWVAQDDVEAGDTQAAWVQRIAHASLRDLLRDGELPSGWEEERRLVRARMRSACAVQVDGWIEKADIGARAGKLASMTRYALLSWLAHTDMAPGTESGARADAWAAVLPSIGSMVSTQRAPFWGAVLENALRSETLPEEVRVDVRSSYGRLLEVCGETAAARALHETNLAFWIGQPMHPHRAGAWTHMGTAYFRQGRFLDAVREYSKAISAITEHIGLPDEPSVEDMNAFAEVEAHRPYLREYATAASAMGHAYLEADELLLSREWIIRGLQAHLALAGILGVEAGQDIPPIPYETREDLSVSYNNFGRLLMRCSDRDGALEAFRAQYFWALCAAHFHPDDVLEQIAARRRDHPLAPLAEVVLPCAGALNQVGLALWALSRHDEARETLSEACALLNALEIPEPANAEEMRASGYGELFEGYGTLQLLLAQDPHIPVDAGIAAAAEGLRVFRKLAFAEPPLDPDAARSRLAAGRARAFQYLRESNFINLVILEREGRADEVVVLIDEAIALTSIALSVPNAAQFETFLSGRMELRLAWWLIEHGRGAHAVALLSEVIAHAKHHLVAADSGCSPHELQAQHLKVAGVVATAWDYIGEAHGRMHRPADARDAFLCEIEVLLAVTGMARDPSDAALAAFADSDRSRPWEVRLCRQFAVAWHNLGVHATDLGDLRGAYHAHRMEVRFECARLVVNPRNPQRALGTLPAEECETLRRAWRDLAIAAAAADVFDVSMDMWGHAVRAECARLAVNWPVRVDELALLHARDASALSTLRDHCERWWRAAYRVGTRASADGAAEVLLAICRATDEESAKMVRELLTEPSRENRAARRQRRRGGTG